MAHRDRDPDLVGQGLQIQLPRPQPMAVAAAGVGADQQAASPIALAAQHPPPAPDALDRKFRRVVAHPDVHQRVVAGHVRRRTESPCLAPIAGSHAHAPLGLGPGSPAPTGVLEGAHELFLLRVDRDHRVTAAHKLSPAR